MSLSRLPIGRRIRVSVPGSSANLGPGFDSLGLALAIRDVIEVEATPVDGVDIEVSGAGAGEVALDESHLVVRVLRETVQRVGYAAPGLRLRCTNTIPHGRGIGSSAAAIVSGVVAARGLLPPQAQFDDAFALQVATDFEGHPDNAAASLYGSAVLGWMRGPGLTDSSSRPQAVAVPLELDPQIRAVVSVPGTELATSKARAMLPASVPHADAAHVAGRAALLVLALTHRPDLLLDATEDRLHQHYRAPAMPETAALVSSCRQHGLAATVSGAGPSVLVLGVGEDLPARVSDLAERLAPGGWQVLAPGIDRRGATLESVQH